MIFIQYTESNQIHKTKSGKIKSIIQKPCNRVCPMTDIKWTSVVIYPQEPIFLLSPEDLVFSLSNTTIKQNNPFSYKIFLVKSSQEHLSFRDLP